MWLALLTVAGCVEDHGLDVRTLDRLEALTIAARGEPPVDPTNRWSDDPAAAHLGQWLFFDARLSRDADVACATCHDPARGFADGHRVSETYAPTDRHAPSLVDVGWRAWLNWDGSCDTLWCQATGPLEHDDEMGFDRAAVAHLLSEDPDLRAAYTQVFGPLPDLSTVPRHAKPGPEDDPRTVAWETLDASVQRDVTEVFVHVAKALAAYQRTLVSGPTPLDRFVAAARRGERGDLGLSPEAIRGAARFVGHARCTLCHFGPGLTNDSFHNAGLGSRAWLPEVDLGRYDGITRLRSHPFSGAGTWSDAPDAAADRLDRLVHDETQHGQFKTPTLRNVARTAPYMHGGHLDDLDAVVRHYDLPFTEAPQAGILDGGIAPLFLTGSEQVEIVAFLHALTSDPLVDPGRIGPPSGPAPTP